MAWQTLIPRMRIEIWPGAYRDMGPKSPAGITIAEHFQLEEANPSSEFSLKLIFQQAALGGKRRPQTMFRFPREATLAEVWRALQDSL